MNKNFQDLNDEEKNIISSKIQFNIKAEAEANEYYFELLNTVAEEDKHIIEEIISDELDHAIKLGKLQEKYSKILPKEFVPLINLKKKGDKNENN